MAENELLSSVTYEELANIETEFEDIYNQIMKTQYEMSKDIYARRADALSKIPNFWPLVIEASPPEFDTFVHPQDSKIFADALTNITVTRHELETSPQGHPRSVTITFDFKEDNPFFTDSSLSKKFSYRRALDGWVGLVSEPVLINWKKGQDPTEGLVAGAHALFAAREKAGDMKSRDLPEFIALARKTEHSNGQNTSFFSWFGFVSSRRWVSAEESEKAEAEHASRNAARARGEKVEMPVDEDDEKDDDDDDDDDDEDEAYGDLAVEVFDDGDDLATTLAEEIWPNAIKYFTQAQEMGLVDEEYSNLGSDEDDTDDDEQPVDIRSLVADKGAKSNGSSGKRQSDGGPPAKKQKK